MSRPRIGKRAVGSPRAMLGDDLRKMAAKNWIKITEDHAQRRPLGEIYVQQWTKRG